MATEITKDYQPPAFHMKNWFEEARQQVDDITHNTAMDIIKLYVRDSKLSAEELEVKTFTMVKTAVNEISGIMLDLTKKRRQQREKAN